MVPPQRRAQRNQTGQSHARHHPHRPHRKIELGAKDCELPLTVAILCESLLCATSGRSLTTYQAKPARGQAYYGYSSTKRSVNLSKWLAERAAQVRTRRTGAA